MLARALAVLLASALAACSGGSPPRNPLQDIPTPITSFEDFATAQFMTENAPPEGFREAVAFPLIDSSLRELSSWRYTLLVQFEGVFARTPRETSARTNIAVWFEQLGSARRVVVESAGELLRLDEGTRYEAVRLGPDTFFVQGDQCQAARQPDTATAADLQAGDLIGGVNRATPTGRRALLDGTEAWEYVFSQGDVNLPFFRLADGGYIEAMTGEIWVAPQLNTVVRYYLTLDIQSGVLLLTESDAQLPVSGRLIIRYDLSDIGEPQNITVPYGC